jgi:hypothetical protein
VVYGRLASDAVAPRVKPPHQIMVGDEFDGKMDHDDRVTLTWRRKRLLA